MMSDNIYSGEDAVRNAYIPDDESEEFGGLSLQ